MKRSVLLVALICTAMLLVGYGTAMAGKPIRGTISVTPDPCPYPGTYFVSGEGFKKNDRVVVDLTRECDDGSTIKYAIWSGQADTSGKFAFSRATESCTGTYRVEARQSSKHGRSKNAGTSFVVY